MCQTERRSLALCPDFDLDGFAACDNGCEPQQIPCGDCDDADPLVHPGAVEACNLRDECARGYVGA